MSFELSFVCLSVCPQCRISALAYPVFFLIFCMKIDNHGNKSSDGFQVLKNRSKRLRKPKKSKTWAENDVSWFLTKTWSIHMYFFYLSMKVLMSPSYLPKTKYLEKILLLSYGSESFRSIGMRNSLNYNSTQMSWGMNISFCDETSIEVAIVVGYFKCVLHLNIIKKMANSYHKVSFSHVVRDT